MPTKTYRRVSDQEPRPFQPSETELFPIEVCGQMARALGINDPDEITRLHQILNYPGSFAHLAAYVKRAGIPAANQRAALKNLVKLLRQTIKFIHELDWQSNEAVAAGYAKERPVFSAPQEAKAVSRRVNPNGSRKAKTATGRASRISTAAPMTAPTK
jgi:hypothetical protein